jgi:uncharacterized protein (TIGR03000 family)
LSLLGILWPAQAASAQHATIVVRVPADATIYVDGRWANLSSAVRTFVTPELPPDKEYFYTIKAEVSRKGRVIQASKRVTFRGGDEVQVDFRDLAAASPAKVVAETPSLPALIAVKLPEHARLYVNGVHCPLNSASASLLTPKLQPGRDYACVLRVESLRGGQIQVETRQIICQAGKHLTVTFRDEPTLSHPPKADSRENGQPLICPG